jgi:hypothetical protein
VPVTYTFSSGGTITAAEVNTNFTDVFNELSGITTSDLASSAGIVSTQLADRFSYPSESIIIAPRLATGGGAATWTLPDSTGSPGTEVFRRYMQLRAGRAAYLCAATIYCNTTTPDSGKYPRIWVARNGTALGGGGADLATSDTVSYLKSGSPYDTPLTSLADGDYLTIGVGVSASTSTATMSGVYVTLHYKIEIGA